MNICSERRSPTNTVGESDDTTCPSIPHL
jgi:hypothetical protein